MNAKPADYGDKVTPDFLQLFHEFPFHLGFPKSPGDEAKDADGRNLHQKHNERQQRVVDLIDHRRQLLDSGSHCRQHAGKDDAKDNQGQKLGLSGRSKEIVRKQHQNQILENGADFLGLALQLRKDLRNFPLLQAGVLFQRFHNLLAGGGFFAAFLRRFLHQVALFLVAHARPNQVHQKQSHHHCENRRA